MNRDTFFPYDMPDNESWHSFTIGQQRQHIQAYYKKKSHALGKALVIFALILLLTNLGFIITSLIYVGFYNKQQQQCLTMIFGFQIKEINLKLWLQVDALSRMGVIFFFVLSAIFAFHHYGYAKCFAGLVNSFFLLYNFFLLAWTITGSILFWNNSFGGVLYQSICPQHIVKYIFALMIFSYLFFLMNLVIFVKAQQIITK